MDTQTRSGKVRELLDGYIHKGGARAAETVNRIMNEVPEDRIVKVAKVTVLPASRWNLPRGEALRPFDLMFPDEAQTAVHPNALSQMCARTELPIGYVNGLQETDWGRGLIAENLNALFRNRLGDQRALTRSVNGETRAFVSDRYRRIDGRPVLDALLGAVPSDAFVVDGFSTDVRFSLTFIRRQIFEPLAGDPIVLGMTYKTSDYGVGAHDVVSFIMRVLCLNGMLGRSMMRQVHLGGRLAEDVEYSKRTYQLDTQATASATKDMARHLLSDKRAERLEEVVRKAAQKQIDPVQNLASIRRDISKAEGEAIVSKYNSPDVEDLPPGNTSWRFSNAVSWLANQQKDGNRRFELQELAGKMLAA